MENILFRGQFLQNIQEKGKDRKSKSIYPYFLVKILFFFPIQNLKTVLRINFIFDPEPISGKRILHICIYFSHHFFPFIILNLCLKGVVNSLKSKCLT